MRGVWLFRSRRLSPDWPAQLIYHLQLLHDLRQLHDPRPESILGVDAIDRLLNIFQYPSSSEPRPVPRWTSPDPEGVSPPRQSLVKKLPIVEITSPSSAGGKTSLLYLLIAKAILPRSHSGIKLDGKASTVIYLDTDGRFSVSRLRQTISSLVRQAANVQSKNPNDSEIDSCALDCLYHVHVMQPQSSASLLATLKSLPSYLLTSKTHFSSTRHVHSIMIDSASAFYWQDRMDEELARFEPTDGPQQAPTAVPRISTAIIHALRDLQRLFSCAIIYTTWGLTPVRPPHGQQQHYSGPASFRPHLPNPWPSFPTLRLVVDREAVPKYGPHMSVDQARRDAPKRQEAVDKGQFVGWVDRWGSEGWSDGIRAALAAVEGKGYFSFRVTRDAVFMRDNED